MADLNRWVGGLRCRDVLEMLTAYLDGNLGPEDEERIHAHLRGCDVCERFGGAFSEMVARMRNELLAPEPLPPETYARVRARLLRDGAIEEAED